jgi:hypothetical protein
VPDLTSPVVSIITPSASSTVRGVVTINSTSSDNVGVTKVYYYRGGSQLITTPSSPFSISWDTTLLADGNYSLTAVAYDTAGNHTTFSPVSVTIDNTAPILSGVASSTVSISDARINWNANEFSTGLAEYGTWASYSASSTFVASYGLAHGITIASLSAGTTCYYRAVSLDTAGNIGVSASLPSTTVSSGGGGGGCGGYYAAPTLPSSTSTAPITMVQCWVIDPLTLGTAPFGPGAQSFAVVAL